MKFFTPDLYLRYNSTDDEEADRADEEWEKAIQEYKRFINNHSINMSSRVKDLAESVCLHDAELLSLQEDIPESSVDFPLPVATVALRSNGKTIIIIYFLWEEVSEVHPAEEWSFSKLRTHWLYDEIDLEERPLKLFSSWRHPHLYWHRILLSDGRVISIPFFDVIVQAISEQNPESAMITKRRA